MLISPTFYQQFLCQFSCAKKITEPICERIKGAQNTLAQKAACAC
jgi:hypothetical protein